jgi:hypothetical protein
MTMQNEACGLECGYQLFEGTYCIFCTEDGCDIPLRNVGVLFYPGNCLDYIRTARSK